MPTVYVRRVNLKQTLSDAEMGAYWKFTMEEVVPALQKVPGIRLGYANNESDVRPLRRPPGAVPRCWAVGALPGP